MRLSALVPHDPEPAQRVRIWEFVAARWAELLPDVEVVTGGLGLEPRSVALARNTAARAATGDVFFATCNDYLPDPRALDEALALIKSGVAWVAPFQHTAYLSEACCEALYTADDWRTVEFEIEKQIPFCNGLIVMRRETWEAVGGQDERFRGPQPEDIAQRQALITLAGPGAQLDHVGYHLHHDRWDEAEPETFAANHERYEREYLPAVGDPAAMREVLGLAPVADEILPKVAVGFCTPGQTETESEVALHDTFMYDLDHGRVLDRNLLHVIGGPRLHALRTEYVRSFLFRSRAEYLWSIDRDMTWEPDAMHELLEHADPDTAPIVGGLCFGTSPSAGPLFPVLFDVAGDHFEVRMNFERDTLVRCDAASWAFLLVHRSVFEAMAAPDAFGKTPDGAVSRLPWFVDGQAGENVMEGDLSFFARAHALGIPVHVHTGIEAAHKKVQFLNLEFFDHVLATQAAKESLP